MSKYKQLKEQDRYTIERMLGQGYNISDIARTLGRDKSTISRALKRNRSGRKVLPDYFANATSPGNSFSIK